MGIRQSALRRLGRNSISAKNIASQAWCERQMELYISTPMPQTAAMARGSAFHEEEKAKVFKPLAVEPVTWPDRFYKTAYENYNSLASLGEKGFCRELRLYGSINGFKISGQLDELRIEEGRTVVIEDKTVGDASGFSPARLKADTIQVSLYRKLLDDLRSGRYTFDNFSGAYSLESMPMSKEFLDGLESIGVRKELQTVRSMYKRMFEQTRAMPELSDTVEIRYIDRRTRDMVSDVRKAYDGPGLDDWIRYSMKYWSGEREAQPVAEEEVWKCRKCRFFGKECKAWWDRYGTGSNKNLQSDN